MNIIEKIKISFNNGEDFQFQQWDINELKQMEKVLQWYADKENYKTYDHLVDCKEITENWVHAVDEDFGYTARIVLGIE